MHIQAKTKHVWGAKDKVATGQKNPPKELATKSKVTKADEVGKSKEKTNYQVLGRIKHSKIVGKITKPRKLQLSPVNSDLKMDMEDLQLSIFDESQSEHSARITPRVDQFSDDPTEQSVLEVEDVPSERQKAEDQNQVAISTCTCVERLSSLAALLNVQRGPKLPAKLMPIRHRLLNVLNELTSVLTLFTLMGLFFTCYVCTRPRKLTTLQSLLLKLYLLFVPCSECSY